MKWENCDINVLKQANIPQFSKLDDIGTPFRLFESFFVDVLVDMIVGYTKLYGLREKVDTSLEHFAYSQSCLCLVDAVSQTYFSFYHNLPDSKIYWEKSPGTFVKAMSR